ncbi:hypothetical protein BDQ12DRAFT_665590 [Crucibulum laeve]|uniref:Protein kinase domain-containing protein n=1 Tax=Crucibulum laeve TaxID=68775 RepID=A0A5C3M206_9AGAR|nr:hypothetical protein BDQ12DRAFT_665590 [Crucibulum laeve]
MILDDSITPVAFKKSTIQFSKRLSDLPAVVTSNFLVDRSGDPTPFMMNFSPFTADWLDSLSSTTHPLPPSFTTPSSDITRTVPLPRPAPLERSAQTNVSASTQRHWRGTFLAMLCSITILSFFSVAQRWQYSNYQRTFDAGGWHYHPPNHTTSRQRVSMTGNVLTYLSEYPDISIKTRVLWVLQVGDAIKTLHSSGIVHGDIHLVPITYISLDLLDSLVQGNILLEDAGRLAILINTGIYTAAQTFLPRMKLTECNLY